MKIAEYNSWNQTFLECQNISDGENSPKISQEINELYNTIFETCSKNSLNSFHKCKLCNAVVATLSFEKHLAFNHIKEAKSVGLDWLEKPLQSQIYDSCPVLGFSAEEIDKPQPFVEVKTENTCSEIIPQNHLPKPIKFIENWNDNPSGIDHEAVIEELKIIQASPYRHLIKAAEYKYEQEKKFGGIRDMLKLPCKSKTSIFLEIYKDNLNILRKAQDSAIKNYSTDEKYQEELKKQKEMEYEIFNFKRRIIKSKTKTKPFRLPSQTVIETINAMDFNFFSKDDINEDPYNGCDVSDIQKVIKSLESSVNNPVPPLKSSVFSEATISDTSVAGDKYVSESTKKHRSVLNNAYIETLSNNDQENSPITMGKNRRNNKILSSISMPRISQQNSLNTAQIIHINSQANRNIKNQLTNPFNPQEKVQKRNIKNSQYSIGETKSSCISKPKHESQGIFYPKKSISSYSSMNNSNVIPEYNNPDIHYEDTGANLPSAYNSQFINSVKQENKNISSIGITDNKGLKHIKTYDEDLPQEENIIPNYSSSFVSTGDDVVILSSANDVLNQEEFIQSHNSELTRDSGISEKNIQIASKSKVEEMERFNVLNNIPRMDSKNLNLVPSFQKNIISLIQQGSINQNTNNNNITINFQKNNYQNMQKQNLIHNTNKNMMPVQDQQNNIQNITSNIRKSSVIQNKTQNNIPFNAQQNIYQSMQTNMQQPNLVQNTHQNILPIQIKQNIGNNIQTNVQPNMLQSNIIKNTSQNIMPNQFQKNIIHNIQSNLLPQKSQNICINPVAMNNIQNSNMAQYISISQNNDSRMINRVFYPNAMYDSNQNQSQEFNNSFQRNNIINHNVNQVQQMNPTFVTVPVQNNMINQQAFITQPIQKVNQNTHTIPVQYQNMQNMIPVHQNPQIIAVPSNYQFIQAQNPRILNQQNAYVQSGYGTTVQTAQPNIISGQYIIVPQANNSQNYISSNGMIVRVPANVQQQGFNPNMISFNQNPNQMYTNR